MTERKGGGGGREWGGGGGGGECDEINHSGFKPVRPFQQGNNADTY